MHVNTTMCVDRGRKGERARQVIGLWKERKVERGVTGWGGRGASVRVSPFISDVFKDNEPHPLHCVGINTLHTHTHTH